MIVAINQEGVEYLKTLAGDLSCLNNDIRQAGATLMSNVSANEGYLGVYLKEIQEIVSTIGRLERDSLVSVDEMVRAVRKLAEDYEKMIAF